MPGILLDGKALADSVLHDVTSEAARFEREKSRKPALAVVLVGEDPASKVYVGAKTKTAKRCGIDVVDVKLPTTVSQHELEENLRALASDSKVDGILLQLPLPKGLKEFAALLCIPAEKDVDGLHPVSQGLLMRGAPGLRPCTPLGCMALIDTARSELGLDLDLSGLRAVVVGRSVLVGKPVALLLLERNCTVIQTHSRTSDLTGEILQADIVVAALGKPEFVKGSAIKQGAIVIDVGINRLDDGRLVGDVHYESASERAAAITPVPKGVGPMTIAMLMKNTVSAAFARAGVR